MEACKGSYNARARRRKAITTANEGPE